MYFKFPAAAQKKTTKVEHDNLGANSNKGEDVAVPPMLFVWQTEAEARPQNTT